MTRASNGALKKTERPPTEAGGSTGALDLENYAPFYLSAVGNRMSRGASRVYLDVFGIGINEWRILANLRAAPGVTAAEICGRSGIDKAAASRAMATLAEAGLVRPAPRLVGRNQSLRLTGEGALLHDRIAVVARQREAALLDGFSAEERADLLTYLRRLFDNLTHNLDRAETARSDTE